MDNNTPKAKRELDALIAERLFGWRWVKYPAPNLSEHRLLTGIVPPAAPGRIYSNRTDRIWQPSTPDAERFSDWDTLYWWDDDGASDIRRGMPHYSTDIAAAVQVEDEIERRGLIRPYLDALWDVTGNLYARGPQAMWALLRATPEERCQAALKALEDTNG